MKSKQNYSIELKEGHYLIAFCEYSKNAFVKIDERDGIRIAEFTLNEIFEEYDLEFNPDDRNSQLEFGKNDLKYFNDIIFNSDDKEDFDFRLSLTH